MFPGNIMTFEVNGILHQTLKVVFNTYGKWYDELRVLNSDFLTNQKYLYFLATEVLKFLNSLSLHLIWSYLNYKSLMYDLRKGNFWNTLQVQSSKYWVNLLLFCGSVLWNVLYGRLKESISIEEFKKQLQYQRNPAYLISCQLYIN